jgi:hypothetical protein
MNRPNNVAKTKEMLIERINKEPPPYIFICSNVIERVSSFRLLGIHIDNNLKWSSHTAYIPRRHLVCIF